MTVYFVLIGLTLFSGFAGELISRKYRKFGKFVKVFVPIVALYLVASMKSVTVGIDTQSYYQKYISMGDYSWKDLTGQQFEVGYMVLSKVCSDLGLSWQQFLFVGYFLIFCPFGILLFWRSDTPTTSLMMLIGLFLGMWLSAYRQSIAAALFALGVSCFASKNWGVKILGIALALVGSTIHHSVIAGFTLFVLYFLKFRKTYVWAFVPFLVLLYFMSPYVYEAIYSLFMGDSKYTPGIYGGGGLFFTFVVMMLVMVYFMDHNKVTNFVDKSLEKTDAKIGRFMLVGEAPEERNKYFNVALWGIALLVAVQAFSHTNQVIVRLKDVMEITAIICFPSFLNSFRSRTVRSLGFLVMNVALVFLVYFNVLRNDYLELVPYEFYFNHMSESVIEPAVSAILNI